MQNKVPYIEIESIDSFYISAAILNESQKKIESWENVFDGTKKEFIEINKSKKLDFYLDDPLMSQIVMKTLGIPLSDTELDLPLSFYDEVKPKKIKIKPIDKT